MSMKGYGTPLVTTKRPLITTGYGLHWAHAAPGGGLIAKREVSWRSISGVIINTPRGAVFLYFRRWQTAQKRKPLIAQRSEHAEQRCPDCGAPIRLLWSGVVCSAECGWWWCW